MANTKKIEQIEEIAESREAVNVLDLLLGSDAIIKRSRKTSLHRQMARAESELHRFCNWNTTSNPR